jgi:chorismate mutase
MTEPSAPFPEEIVRLRHSIDNIDGALMYLLAERFKCTQRVGELKAQGGLPPEDLTRETQQIKRLAEIAASAGLDTVFAETFRSFIVTEVKRRHQHIADERGDDVPILDIYS